jgi:hypothetical protein
MFAMNTSTSQAADRATCAKPNEAEDRRYRVQAWSASSTLW